MYNSVPHPDVVEKDLEVFLGLPAVNAAGIRDETSTIMASYGEAVGDTTDGTLSFGGGVVTLELVPIEVKTIRGTREMLGWQLTEFKRMHNGHWEPDDLEEVDGGTFRNIREALLAVLSRFVGWELDSAWFAEEEYDRSLSYKILDEQYANPKWAGHRLSPSNAEVRDTV